MNWNEYQVKALRTMAEQGAILTRLVAYGPRAMQLDNGARGLSDEVGEINAAVKKYIEYGKPLDVANIKEEVGDCLWRLTQICHAVGLSLQECAEGNINKLAVRYPDVYSDHLAAEESRDRASEAQAVATTAKSTDVALTYEERLINLGWTSFGTPLVSGDYEYLFENEISRYFEGIGSNKDKTGLPHVCKGYIYGFDTWEPAWYRKLPTAVSEVVSEPIVQNGNGFGEPPEVDESVSRHSYTKTCCKCGRPVHKTSQTNPPTCSACYVPAC